MTLSDFDDTAVQGDTGPIFMRWLLSNPEYFQSMVDKLSVDEFRETILPTQPNKGNQVSYAEILRFHQNNGENEKIGAFFNQVDAVVDLFTRIKDGQDRNEDFIDAFQKLDQMVFFADKITSEYLGVPQFLSRFRLLVDQPLDQIEKWMRAFAEEKQSDWKVLPVLEAVSDQSHVRGIITANLENLVRHIVHYNQQIRTIFNNKSLIVGSHLTERKNRTQGRHIDYGAMYAERKKLIAKQLLLKKGIETMWSLGDSIRGDGPLLNLALETAGKVIIVLRSSAKTPYEEKAQEWLQYLEPKGGKDNIYFTIYGDEDDEPKSVA